MSEPWDKEAIYDEKISPLMKQIIALCHEHQIPMVMQFQVANTEENGPLFCTTALPLPNACDKIKDLARRVQPEKPVVLAETTITHPDGSKEIRIKQIQ